MAGILYGLLYNTQWLAFLPDLMNTSGWLALFYDLVKADWLACQSDLIHKEG
jgi:hypothetical protein